MTDTIFWHDYETNGADPVWDRPVQFAGIRTDLNLQPIEDPVELFCAPQPDSVPHPEAILITRITPQIAAEKGVPEYRFAEQIHRQLSRPGTTGAGYNSIRFDDEVTRNLLYRNFYDPYAREWRSGNSRWDIIDMLRMVAALRPEGIEWPRREDGAISFRLELLTESNNIEHAGAHDALVDVRATIAMAALVRKLHPELYDYCWNLRKKNFVAGQIDLAQQKPFLHVSSKISALKHCTALMMPISTHPRNSNGIICFDLGANPETLLDLSIDELRERLYHKRDDDETQPTEPLGVKTVHLNKTPMVVTAKMLTEPVNERLQIDKTAAEKSWNFVREHPELRAKITELLDQPYASESTVEDPELELYSGFLSDADRQIADDVRRADPVQLAEQRWPFEDRRMAELLFRYRARNWPESLSSEEREVWNEFRNGRLHQPWRSGAISLSESQQRIEKLRTEHSQDPQAIQLLADCEAWLKRLQRDEYEA